jgi:hypothetical protein
VQLCAWKPPAHVSVVVLNVGGGCVLAAGCVPVCRGFLLSRPKVKVVIPDTTNNDASSARGDSRLLLLSESVTEPGTRPPPPSLFFRGKSNNRRPGLAWLGFFCSNARARAGGY